MKFFEMKFWEMCIDCKLDIEKNAIKEIKKGKSYFLAFLYFFNIYKFLFFNFIDFSHKAIIRVHSLVC